MALVAIDARDASAQHLRGWGRYASCLVDALEAGPHGDLALHVISAASRGPEVLFEQLALPFALVKRHASLVHATNCFLPLVRPCPGVVTVHDLAFEAWPSDFKLQTRVKYRTLAPLAARSAQRVICPSRFTADDLISRFGVESSRIRVIPEAPALPSSAAEGEASSDPPPGAPYILAVGDLRAKKNLGALVSAFAALREQRSIPHRLVLAGLDAGASGALRRLAGQAPVELTGYTSDAQLDALIRGAEVLVHPSLYEGFGLVILEAMVRGTPVLAARATALPETAGDAAAFFDPAEKDGLRHGLEELLDDTQARRELSEGGRRRAAEFSWERTAQETMAVYRELV